MMDCFSQVLADNVAKRTLGVEWASSEVEGLEFYRQNAPTSNSVCIVEPKYCARGARREEHDLGGARY